MKKKNGFVFLESVISLVVVALALTAFLKSYTNLANKSKQNEVYDNISDKYLLYSIANMGSSGSNKLYDVCSNSPFGASKDEIWLLRKDKKEAVANKNMHCWTKNFFENDGARSKMFEDAGLVYFYYIENLDKDVLSRDSTAIMDNGALQYVQTLSRNKSYCVGVFRRSGRYYYASIVIYDGTNE